VSKILEHPKTRRKKIWELEHRFHCSLIGTCLELDELRRLGRKLKMPREVASKDYRLHNAFVGLVGERCGGARLVHKHLDRKYADTLRNFQDMTTSEELHRLWRKVLKSGEIAAAYWALVTHPATDEELLLEVYGEVHMLSHLSGASVRVDMDRLAHLRRRIPELQQRIQQLQQEVLRRIQEKKVAIEQLQQEIQARQQAEREARSLKDQVTYLGRRPHLARLEKQVESLSRDLARARAGMEHAESEARKWKTLAGSYRDRCRQHETRAAHISTEKEVLEKTLERLLAPDCENCDARESCSSNLDLCNRCILFVGGRNRQSSHFRSLVEQHNGRFLHHDGGLEENSKRLTTLLTRADAVLCPLDCISHDAVNRIKRDCKRYGKPLQLLPKASLAAFARGLEKVTTSPTSH